MSDESDGWIDLSRIPGWQRYYLGVQSVARQPHDPEDTMQLAITHRELALFVFGVMLVGTLFPELRRAVIAANHKLIELSAAQDFIPWDDQEGG